MEKTLKIDIPDGYEIDKEKSTFETIVFKKVDDVVIKWNKQYGSVDIIADGEKFRVFAETPFKCFNKNTVLSLPTIRQFHVLTKYIDKVNEIIYENNGYEIKDWIWCSKDENNDCVSLERVHHKGICGGCTSVLNYIRPICNL